MHLRQMCLRVLIFVAAFWLMIFCVVTLATMPGCAHGDRVYVYCEKIPNRAANGQFAEGYKYVCSEENEVKK